MCLKDTPARQCARRERPSPRPDNIVRGVPAGQNAWPWMVRINSHLSGPGVKRGWYGCGGTLIAPTVVLTAAHCLSDDRSQSAVTRAGVWATLGRRVLSRIRIGERIRVRQVELHEGWSSQTMVNDVALLHLARPSRQRPAVIGDATDWGSFGRAMGWGHTGAKPSSDVLLAVDLPMRQDQVCQATPELPVPYDPSVMLCAGGDGRDTCFGDSGGPLMTLGGPQVWELVGVTSFGEIGRCGSPGVPGVYAWVAGDVLRAWIAARI